jgi:hypothetical protein
MYMGIFIRRVEDDTVVQELSVLLLDEMVGHFSHDGPFGNAGDVGNERLHGPGPHEQVLQVPQLEDHEGIFLDAVHGLDVNGVEIFRDLCVTRADLTPEDFCQMSFVAVGRGQKGPEIARGEVECQRGRHRGPADAAFSRHDYETLRYHLTRT